MPSGSPINGCSTADDECTSARTADFPRAGHADADVAADPAREAAMAAGAVAQRAELPDGNNGTSVMDAIAGHVSAERTRQSIHAGHKLQPHLEARFRSATKPA